MSEPTATVVILHGWAGHPSQYEQAAAQIRSATGMPVVTPLLPVVSEPGTRWAPKPLTVATLPGCARELVPQLPDGPLIVIGHSLGGGVAIALAPRIVNRLQHLVLVSPVGGDPRPSVRAWLNMLEGYRMETPQNMTLMDPRTREAAGRAFLRHPIASTRLALSAKHADLRRPLHRIVQAGIPVDLVIPRDDKIVNTGRLARVPGVRVHEVTGNHGWPLYEPQDVGRFFKELLTPTPDEHPTAVSPDLA